MIPKAGDRIRFTKEFAEYYHDHFVWSELYGKELLVEDVSIDPRDPEYFKVKFEERITPFNIHIASGFAANCNQGIPVFELCDAVSSVDSSVYCSCGGPVKDSMTFSGVPFKVCKVCKKEKA